MGQAQEEVDTGAARWVIDRDDLNAKLIEIFGLGYYEHDRYSETDQLLPFLSSDKPEEGKN